MKRQNKQSSASRIAELEKELEIEAAMDRIRARAMAMHSSGELVEVADVLREQMGLLGQPDLETTAVQLYDDNSNIFESLYAFRPSYGPEGKSISASTTFPKDSCELVREMLAMYQSPVTDYTLQASGAKRQEWFEVLQKAAPEIVKYAVANEGAFPETSYFHFSDFRGGTLLTVSYQPPSNEVKALLRRAASVFDLAYRRFTDLQKAEAQAREAQIQLSLERVRAKTIAMHNSDDVADTVITMFDELVKLGIEKTARCGIAIIDDNREMELWRASYNADGNVDRVIGRIDMTIHPLLAGVYQAWKNNEAVFSWELTGKDQEDYFRALSDSPEYPVQFDLASLPAKQINSVFFFPEGCVYVFTIEPLSPGAVKLFKRFAAVFGLTYRRYLDLQQAEAQAREARVEAALERVRSRTMAMQKSEELAEVIQLTFEQFVHLNFTITNANFNTDYLAGNDANLWLASSNQSYPAKIFVPYSDHPVFNIPNTARDKGADHFITSLTFGEKNQFLDHFFKKATPIPDLPRPLLDRLYNAPGFYSYGVLMKTVSFTITNYQGYAYTEAEQAVVARFGKVFEQTYTRFNDLKQAEEQAREAQIETALEKVRGKAMAMHDSNDLSSAVSMVFTELKKLGIKPIRCGVGLFTKEPPRTLLYTATISNDSDTLDLVGWVDVVGHPVLEKIFDSWLNQEDYFPVLNGKELKTYYKKLSHGLHIPSIPDGRSDEKQYGHFLPFPEGMLNAWAERPYSEPELKILDRFKSIISLTFRRYLDLKKAEEQARESQIQLGLERVRAKAMAMQTSEELNELIGTVFGELTKLDFVLTRCLIMIFNPETNSSRWWMANSEAPSEPMNYLVQYHKNPAYAAYLKAWKARDLKWRYALKGKVKRDWDNFLFVETELSLLPDFVIAGMKAPEQVLLSASFNNFGCLTLVTLEPMSDEHSDIMLRFAKVFDMSYTRFNDLKQAEAQAKESQIQLALERVRARTMAMQKSEELAETAAVLFQQLLNLGISSERTFIGMPNDDTRKIELWGTEQGGHQMSMRFEYEADATYAFREIYKAWLEKRSEFTVILKGKNLDEHVNYVRNVLHMPILVGLVQQQRMLYNAFFSKGLLMIVTPETQSKETLEILQRFAGVFDGTYTRFLDLQKAEAQGRESQIQLALERVRARTMAMQKSDELVETAMTLFQQFSDLGVEPERIFIGNMDENTRMIEFWGIDLGGKHPRFEINADATIGFSQIYKAWKAKKKTHTVIMKGQELADHVRYVEDVLHMPMQPELVQRQRIMYSAFFSKGLLMIVTPEIQSTETLEILQRFAGVFDGTYTRFLDLQKAEAQGRESQIQLALERVRARTMAMQKSEELAETATVLFQQLLNLGISAERTIIGLPKDDTGKIEFWGTEQGGNQISTRFEYEADATYAFREIYKAWQEKRSELTVILKGKNLEEHVNYVRNVLHVPLLAGLVQKQRMLYNAFFSKGWLEIVTPDTQSKETLDILQRFAGVFDGTYTRFLDLQKAEAQARDAKIEASLERVRSKTMAMHNSQDVSETVAVMFDELVKLGVETTSRLGIVIIDDTSHMEVWTASADAQGKTSMRIGRLDMTIHPLFQGLHTAWKNKETVFSCPLAGEDVKAYYRTLNNSPDYPSQFNLDNLPKRQEYNSFIFPEGAIFIFSLQPLATEITQIFKKFAGVFGQTYRRYLDLQKAETQAREAQIEASLERVRGKALAMYNSKDLSSTASLVFTELRKLGVNSKRCGVALLSKNSRHTQLYVATTTLDTDSLDLVGAIELSGHPSLEKQYESWLKNEDYFTILKGEELKSYKELIYSMLPVPYDHSYHEEFGYYLAFSEGFLFSWAERPFTEIEINILNRFKSIIDLTFRRYIELQKSEANAREAVRQSSLDRVRAEIASMRTTGDLDRITPLIWNELTILGVPFIRCGVFIMDEPLQLIHTYLSTPDGKAIAAFQLHFNADNGNGVNGVALQGWRQKQAVTLHWTEEEFRNFSHSLMEQGEIASEEGYLTEHPPSGLDLHFFPFLQGMLYAGNTEPLSDDDKDLVQSLADAFSTAYARYEDFNRLELAKQQVENTLSDLKSAQTKLVQSEKMASLGELTAGIAHEIQNPLNFVNNFSEVNQEMIEELEEELNAGNIEEALALAADIKQNEEKINHHGKRADGIVKGMLEHSRTGGGEKVPINMNALADEFMRLSYHGLRAKDKAFNAEMITNFDAELPKINVIGQDMGRVILNLFNNAFYAVNQKKKTADADYKPEVSVTTSTENGRVVVKVKDNGIGIPDAIKEKIMQPFFTTKPTGEGTGLGLSLTYDMVVKGHGGSIQVNSVEGEGSEFIIQLPIN